MGKNAEPEKIAQHTTSLMSKPRTKASIWASPPKKDSFALSGSSISVLLPGVGFLTHTLLMNSFLLLRRQKAGVDCKYFCGHWLYPHVLALFCTSHYMPLSYNS